MSAIAGGWTEPREAEGPVVRFASYLQAHRLRLTTERQAVLEEILGRSGHFDAEEILEFLRRRRRRVSRATVYRTLEHLQGRDGSRCTVLGRGRPSTSPSTDGATMTIWCATGAAR